MKERIVAEAVDKYRYNYQEPVTVMDKIELGPFNS